MSRKSNQAILQTIEELSPLCPEAICSKKCDIHVDNLLQALELAQKHSLIDKQMQVLHMTARCYLCMNRFDDSMEYVLQLCRLTDHGHAYPRLHDVYSIYGRVLWVKSNWDQAAAMYRRSLELARAADDRSAVAGNYMNISSVLREQGNYAESLRNIELAIEAFASVPNEYYLNSAKSNKANILSYMGKLNEALQTKLEVIEYTKSIHDDKQLGIELNALSTMYYHMNRLDKAIEAALESLRLKELTNDEMSIIQTIGNLGIYYKDSGDAEHAMECYNRALPYYRKIGRKEGVVTVLINIGNLHMEQGNGEMALEVFLEALEISMDMGDQNLMPTTMTNIAQIYQDFMHKPDITLDYLERALEIVKSNGNRLRQINIMLNKIGALIQLRRYEDAHALLTETESALRETPYECYQTNLLEMYIEYYTATGHFEDACREYKQYCAAQEKSYKIAIQNKTNELQTRYEMEKKDREAELMRQRNIELEAKNSEIEAQKTRLQVTLDRLQNSEIRYDFVTEELNRNVRASLVGDSNAIRRIIEMISMVAGSDNINVLITGETGTGKEIVARNIHACSGRGKKPFYAVNCSAIPETLFESQFFGHEKDAFTGATTTKIGWFEIADKSTLFLDEIGTLSQSQQAKLLRVLEERTIVRVGSHREIPVNVRIISATNVNLLDEVNSGAFRRDLYHRLAVFVIHIPPLRERRDEIPGLLNHFVGLSSVSLKKKITRVEKDIVPVLMNYDFPGNVRELKNMVERAVLVADSSTLRLEHFALPGAAPAANPQILPLEEAERRLLVQALRATGFNRTQAAGLLGVERKVVERKIAKHGITPQELSGQN